MNARTIGFFPKGVWPKLMQECMRVLRHGGTIRLTESEWGFTNGPATEKLQGMFYKALLATGRSFTQDGRRHGITMMLAGFLRDAGCINIGQMAHVIDFSAGTDAHKGFYNDWKVVYKLSQPFFVGTEVTTQEEVDSAIYGKSLLASGLRQVRGDEVIERSTPRSTHEGSWRAA